MITLAIVLALTIAGTPTAEDTSVVVAALRHVSAELPMGVKYLNTRPLRDDTVGKAAGFMESRSDERNRALASTAGLRSAHEEDVRECGNGACRIRDGVAVISVGEPRLRGDSAQIRVRVEYETNSEHVPLAQYESILILRRQKSVWSVVKEELLRIT